MSENLATLSAMHTDHQYWKLEHDAWRRDIALWQDEYEAMRAALKQLEGAVHRHCDALRRHMSVINEHEAVLDLHEREIAERETGHQPRGLADRDSDAHQQCAIAHLEQRQVHERMKREHYTLVTQLERLDSIVNQ